jgi:gas vesicle protein
MAGNVLKTSGYRNLNFTSMNTAMKVLSGFLGGAVVGTIAGILMAPDRGSNTRRKIKDESKRLSHEIGESVAQTMHTLTHSFRDGAKKPEYENGELERRKVNV